MANKNANAKLINKKLHAICEDHTTLSVPLGLTKKEEPSVPTLESMTIIFEYAPEKTFSLKFTPEELKKMTSGELFTDGLTRLLTLLDQNPGLSEVIHIESIVSIQTKKRDLMKDYYLTIDDKKIDFLEDNTVLTFYHKTFVSLTEESPIESRVSLKDFEILAKLGAGGFATVYLGNNTFYFLPFLIVDILSSEMEEKREILCFKTDGKGFSVRRRQEGAS